MRSSETQQKLDMLTRMGSLCRILNRLVRYISQLDNVLFACERITALLCWWCSHFVTSKKAALPLDEVLQKLTESHSSELAKGTYILTGWVVKGADWHDVMCSLSRFPGGPLSAAGGGAGTVGAEGGDTRQDLHQAGGQDDGHEDAGRYY